MDYLSRIEEAIWFRGKFLEVLKSGEKSGTLRLGRRIPRHEVLPIIVSETQEELCRARIDTLAWLRFSEIVYYPVILDREYPHEYNQIWDEMRAVYPSISEESWVTFYGFTTEW